jgi:hypothetical protein
MKFDWGGEIHPPKGRYFIVIIIESFLLLLLRGQKLAP